jgi:hypothetical protein
MFFEPTKKLRPGEKSCFTGYITQVAARKGLTCLRKTKLFCCLSSNFLLQRQHDIYTFSQTAPRRPQSVQVNVIVNPFLQMYFSCTCSRQFVVDSIKAEKEVRLRTRKPYHRIPVEQMTQHIPLNIRMGHTQGKHAFVLFSKTKRHPEQRITNRLGYLSCSCLVTPRQYERWEDLYGIFKNVRGGFVQGY